MPRPLEGIRILDLGSGPASGIATMILADFGAEVLVLEGPGEEIFARLPASNMWGRGKRTASIDLDSEEGAIAFNELCAAADVLVCNWRPGALARKGLDFDTLHSKHAHLIFCHVTGFGSVGPRADCPGYEHLVAAATGRMRLFAGIVPRKGPVFSALQVGVHACAQSTVSGILAALLERGDDGEGRLVETSLLQGMLAYEQYGMLTAQLWETLGDDSTPPPPLSDEPPMPSLYYHPAQAGDGRWLQFGNLLPHLFDNFLVVTDLTDVLVDPEFDHVQMILPEEKHEAFRQRMLARIQERSAEEWIEDCIDNGGVAATIYETTQQALQNPDVVANGHVIERPDGSRQIGPLARLVRTPAVPGPDAASGDDLMESWRATPRARPAGRPPHSRQAQLPLAGVRVVELATIIAAPMCASLLADMGAEVIKVEAIGGDPFRGQLGGIGATRVNGGKRSICIDLKSTAGREIVLDLIKDADVLIHNFRPGVPERLGVGYEAVEAINPGIVYLQANGYGPDGPGAHRPSTHPIPGAAMGGVMYQMGEQVPAEIQDMDELIVWTRRMMRANDVNPDPNTALVLTTATLLGLLARKRTGLGQPVLVDMFGANAYANSDDFLSYPGKPPRAAADPQLLGLSATYRLYACADDQWVFLALTTDRERRRFGSALDKAGIDAPTIDLLSKGGELASDTLGALFMTRDATFWESILASEGVGCVRADAVTPSEFYLNDPQSDALGLTSQIEHAHWGTFLRHGSLVRFDRLTPDLGAAPVAGQHSEELLLERGHDAAGIARLVSEGVVGLDDAP